MLAQILKRLTKIETRLERLEDESSSDEDQVPEHSTNSRYGRHGKPAAKPPGTPNDWVWNYGEWRPRDELMKC